MKLKYLSILSVICLSACASVRQEDTDSWVGAPVSALETHPVFLTMHLVRARASDGTEIWNYVNGTNVSSCSSFATASNNGYLDMATYNGFSSCMSTFKACNNIFYVKNGRVTAYTPIGTGGGRCYTDDRAKPNFHGATNYQ